MPASLEPQALSVPQAQYQAAQADSALTDGEKIRNAVDTYFTLRYTGRRLNRVPDLKFLFAIESEGGQTCLEYETGLLQYCSYGWQRHTIQWSAYNYRPEYPQIFVSGNKAIVQVQPWVDYSYADVPEERNTAGSELHTIKVRKAHGAWQLVEDSYESELRDMIPSGTDFHSLLAQLPRAEALWEAEQVSLAQGRDKQARQPADAAGAAGTLSYRTYGRSAAGAYARRYSSNSSGTGSYNLKFKPYASDCQNFVSQCVWAGFGGQDDAAYIENHSLPMLDAIPGAEDWWCDKDGTTSTWHWTGVSYFEDWVETNDSQDRIGVQGCDGSLSSVEVGDVVRQVSQEHVFIVDRVLNLDGDEFTDYNEIYCCAHTENRRDVRLADLFANPSSVRFLWILTYRNP